MRELTIGALFPLTGPLSSDVGVQCVEAVRAATEMFTPSGWRVRVAQGDPSSVEVAATETERLIREEGAHVLVGSLRSDLALPESETAERAGRVFWAVTGTAADEITSRGLRHCFRLSASASNCYSRAAVDFIADVLAPEWGIEPGRVGVGAILEESAFPRSFGAVALELAARRGMRTVGPFMVPDAVGDLRPQVDRVAAAGAHVLLSAGFRNVVPSLWRALLDRRPSFRALVGISGWAFPRDAAFRASGYERAFTLGGPYLWSADRSGLPAESRERLERWWARSTTPPGQELALDRDLAFSGVYVLLQHVLPRISSPGADEIARAAMALDIPMGGTPVGYGVKFDPTGDNSRTYALVMQWQHGKRVTVHPERFAVATADVRPPFPALAPS